MPVFERLREELTKERENAFLDGIVSNPMFFLYRMTGRDMGVTRKANDASHYFWNPLYHAGSIVSLPATIVVGFLDSANELEKAWTQRRQPLKNLCYEH